MTDGVEERLLAAYSRTHFRVTGVAAPFDLQIGRYSEELASLHAVSSVSTSSFITAWNPRSVKQDARWNQEAQARLETELRALGVSMVAGIGEDPCGQWEGEPSVLVLGISRLEAERIGRSYGQNAIVWCGKDAVPELLVLSATSGATE